MNVILLAENHYNALGLVRSLGEANHTIFLILKKCKINFVSKSRYITSCYYINNVSELKELLVSLYSHIASKPVLVVSTEEYADFVDANYSFLQNFCYTEGGGFDNSLVQYRKKSYANHLAKKCGLTIPQSWMLYNRNELSQEFSFPVLVKADKSVKGWKNAMKKCNDKLELQHHLNSLDDSLFPLQVQQYVEKEYEMMIQGVSLNGGSQVYIPVGHRKIRFYPTEYSLGSYSESFLVSDNLDTRYLSECIESFVKSIHYTGLFSAEFLYSKGIYYFLETNLRNDATSIVSTRCGYNLVDTLCNSFLGKFTAFQYVKYKKSFYMYIIADFHHVLSGKISLKRWIHQLMLVRAFSYFDKSDIVPFFYYLLSVIISKFK